MGNLRATFLQSWASWGLRGFTIVLRQTGCFLFNSAVRWPFCPVCPWEKSRFVPGTLVPQVLGSGEGAQGEIIYAPPPSPQFWAEGIFKGEGGGGVYFEAPPRQDFIRESCLCLRGGAAWGIARWRFRKSDRAKCSKSRAIAICDVSNCESQITSDVKGSALRVCCDLKDPGSNHKSRDLKVQFEPRSAVI